MSDFEEFQAALASHSGTRDSDGEPTYMNSLMNSMSLVLDEFYKNLKVSGVFYFILTLNNIVIVRLLVCQV
jgi:GPN-loop GTPase